MARSYEEYERPSLAADIAAFGISSEDSGNRRQGKIKKLKLLLIKRGEDPFIGKFALPGGFIRKGETIEETAKRELLEETGVSEPTFINSGIYSAPGRDPRGWIVSAAFLALSDTVSLKTDKESDASQALWFDFSYRSQDSTEIITLTCEGTALTITSTDGELTHSDLAFDHGKIILDAFMKLRDEAVNHDIVFDMLPDMFPISEFQQIYETITDTRDGAANFRRKMKDKITETDQYEEAAAHRPSKLYRRNFKEEIS